MSERTPAPIRPGKRKCKRAQGQGGEGAGAGAPQARPRSRASQPGRCIGCSGPWIRRLIAGSRVGRGLIQ